MQQLAEMLTGQSGRDTSSPRIPRKRVALLGGSFDPITDAHLKCAAEIVHCGAAAEVWLVPCGNRPDKPSLKRSVLDRLLMCHLAVNTTFGSGFPVKVSDIELHEEKALPTWDLLQMLNRKRPDIEPLFVIGSDLVPHLKEWDEGQRLWDEIAFIVIRRPGYELGAQELPPKAIELEAPGGAFTLASQEMSSSEIRKRLTYVPQQPPEALTKRSSSYVPQQHKFGERELEQLSGRNYSMVEGLIPAAVLAHIIRYDLYKE